MNLDAVKRHMEYLKNDKFDREFYIALILYDVCGMPVEQVTEEIIYDTHEIIDSYDSIYDNFLRDHVREDIYDYDNEFSKENNESETNYDEIDRE